MIVVAVVVLQLIPQTLKYLQSFFISLDQGSEMIIFESILTTFIAASFLAAAGAVAKIEPQ